MLHFLKILQDIDNTELNPKVKFVGIIFGKEKIIVTNKSTSALVLSQEYFVNSYGNVFHTIETVSPESKLIKNLKVITASSDTISAFITIKSQKPSDKFYIRETEDNKGIIVGTISKKAISRIWNIKNFNFNYIQEELKLNSKIDFIKKILFINKFYYNSDK